MTHSLALVHIGIRIGRWILPWVAVVFVSATLVYAINGAIAGGSSAGDQRPDVRVGVSTGEGTGTAPVERSTTSPAAQSADLGPSVTVEHCASIGSDGNGSYVDSSIVAEIRKSECGWAP